MKSGFKTSQNLEKNSIVIPSGLGALFLAGKKRGNQLGTHGWRNRLPIKISWKETMLWNSFV